MGQDMKEIINDLEHYRQILLGVAAHMPVNENQEALNGLSGAIAYTIERAKWVRKKVKLKMANLKLTTLCEGSTEWHCRIEDPYRNIAHEFNFTINDDGSLVVPDLLSHHNLDMDSTLYKLECIEFINSNLVERYISSMKNKFLADMMDEIEGHEVKCPECHDGDRTFNESSHGNEITEIPCPKCRR